MKRTKLFHRKDYHSTQNDYKGVAIMFVVLTVITLGVFALFYFTASYLFK